MNKTKLVPIFCNLLVILILYWFSSIGITKNVNQIDNSFKGYIVSGECKSTKDKMMQLENQKRSLELELKNINRRHSNLADRNLSYRITKKKIHNIKRQIKKTNTRVQDICSVKGHSYSYNQIQDYNRCIDYKDKVSRLEQTIFELKEAERNIKRRRFNLPAKERKTYLKDIKNKMNASLNEKKYYKKTLRKHCSNR